MKQFVIYEEQIDGSGCKEEVISAESKKQALEMFFQKTKMPEEEKWRYYAVDKEKDDYEKAILKEAGCLTWDEYYDELYPRRPIEL